MKLMWRACTGVLFALALAACPPPAQQGGGGGGGGASAGISPDSCGKIDTSSVGRKVYAFLVASQELDRASLELENTVKGACAKMARDLGVSDAGDTKTVCMTAKQALDANLQVSVKTEKKFVTKYTPPVCHTDVSFAADFTAQCEAKASADINIQCQGQCGGTCNGACDGTCEAQGPNGQCAGQCNGQCNGSCSGQCNGYANVNASAECKASAEVRATTHTTCGARRSTPRYCARRYSGAGSPPLRMSSPASEARASHSARAARRSAASSSATLVAARRAMCESSGPNGEPCSTITSDPHTSSRVVIGE